MKTVFVDANVFLRFFTTDDEGHHRRAASLFRNAADGKVRLVTGPPVLFEIAWTLRSAYSVTREKVVDALGRIVSLPGLRLTDAETVEEALGLAKSSSQEFADAYIAVLAKREGAHSVATFNRKHFERMGTTVESI